MAKPLCAPCQLYSGADSEVSSSALLIQSLLRHVTRPCDATYLGERIDSTHSSDAMSDGGLVRVCGGVWVSWRGQLFKSPAFKRRTRAAVKYLLSHLTTQVGLRPCASTDWDVPPGFSLSPMQMGGRRRLVNTTRKHSSAQSSVIFFGGGYEPTALPMEQHRCSRCFLSGEDGEEAALVMCRYRGPPATSPASAAPLQSWPELRPAPGTASPGLSSRNNCVFKQGLQHRTFYCGSLQA